jgi:hypothetical protein
MTIRFPQVEEPFLREDSDAVDFGDAEVFDDAPAGLGAYPWSFLLLAPYAFNAWRNEDSTGASPRVAPWTEPINPPTLGVLLNGKVGARFAAINQLAADGFVTKNVLGTDPRGWTAFFVFQPEDLQLPGSAVYDKQALLGDAFGWWGVSVDADGIVAWMPNGAAGNAIVQTTPAPVSVGTVYVVCARWTGYQLQLRLGTSGSMTTGQVAASSWYAIAEPTYPTIAEATVRLGVNYNLTSYVDATVWAGGLVPRALTDAEVDDVAGQLAAYFGLGAAPITIGGIGISAPPRLGVGGRIAANTVGGVGASSRPRAGVAGASSAVVVGGVGARAGFAGVGSVSSAITVGGVGSLGAPEAGVGGLVLANTVGGVGASSSPRAGAAGAVLQVVVGGIGAGPGARGGVAGVAPGPVTIGVPGIAGAPLVGVGGLTSGGPPGITIGGIGAAAFPWTGVGGVVPGAVTIGGVGIAVRVKPGVGGTSSANTVGGVGADAHAAPGVGGLVAANTVGGVGASSSPRTGVSGVTLAVTVGGIGAEALGAPGVAGVIPGAVTIGGIGALGSRAGVAGVTSAITVGAPGILAAPRPGVAGLTTAATVGGIGVLVAPSGGVLGGLTTVTVGAVGIPAFVQAGVGAVYRGQDIIVGGIGAWAGVRFGGPPGAFFPGVPDLLSRPTIPGTRLELGDVSPSTTLIVRLVTPAVELVTRFPENLMALNIGDKARIPLTVRRPDVDRRIDPGAISLLVKAPSGASVTYAWPGPSIVRDAIGEFYGLHPCTEAGRHWFRWTTSGVGAQGFEAAGVEEGFFVVSEPKFT